jgi:hypothetical protein
MDKLWRDLAPHSSCTLPSLALNGTAPPLLRSPSHAISLKQHMAVAVPQLQSFQPLHPNESSKRLSKNHANTNPGRARVLSD